MHTPPESAITHMTAGAEQMCRLGVKLNDADCVSAGDAVVKWIHRMFTAMLSIYAVVSGAANATGGVGPPRCGRTMANCMLCRCLFADEEYKGRPDFSLFTSHNKFT